MKLLKYSLLVLTFYSCSEYPTENLEYYDNGTIRIKTIFLNSNGERNVFYYLPSGKLSHEYNYKDSYNNGIYQSYYKNGQIKEKYTLKEDKYSGNALRFYLTGEMQSKAIFNENKLVSSKSFDKKGVLYNEFLSIDSEVLYQYYKDTALYEKLYITKTLSQDGSVQDIKEDSTFYYSEGGELLIKINNDLSKVKVSTYSNSGQLILDDYLVKSKYELDSIKSLLIGRDSINLFYQFKTK